MAWIQIVNIPHWTVQDVQEWMKGLDDDLQCYRGTFEDNHVGGKKLLSLQAEDLEDLQINKIGHQELLLEAIGLLRDLNFNLPTDTLQSVTLSLSCGAKHLHSVVAKRQRERENYNVEPSLCSDGLASDILTFVTHVITSARLLISWLDRLPFSLSSEYNAVRQKVLEHVMKLNSFSQLTGDAAIVERAILTTSKELLVLSEDFIRNACDPLIIQPAYVEVVTLRKSSTDVELGLYIKTSTLDGIHYITDTKIGSPAHNNEKIQPGDEVLQINKQTVVGWNHNKLIGALKADKSGVVLTLKKRPCNLKTPGHVINSHRWAGKSQPSSGSGKPHIKIKPSNRRKLVQQGSNSVDDELEDTPQQQNNGKPRKCIEKDGSSLAIKDNAEKNELQTKEVSKAFRDPDSAYTEIDETNRDTKNEDRMRNSTPAMSTKSDNTQQDVERKEMESSTEKDADPAENEEKIIGSEGTQIQVIEPSLNNQGEDVGASDLSDATSLGGESLDRDRPSYKKSDTLSVSSTSSRGSQVKLRQNKGSGRSRKDRHVSCVDLGPGQYEGWLEKKTDTRFGTKWSRVWCVLKDFVFYYYKSKKDLKAKGIICLVGYEVTSDEGKKPNLFKISHKGLKPFIFSAERKKDLDAWLEKMQLVSVTFNPPDVVQESENTELLNMAKDMEGYHSESDDEDSSSVSLSTSGSHQDVDVQSDVNGQRSSSASAGDELLLAAVDSADSPSLKKASSMSLLAVDGGEHTQNGRLPNNESGTLIKSNSFSSLTAHTTKPKVKSGNAASPGVMRRLKKALKSKSHTDIKRSYTTASEYTKHKKNSAPAINIDVEHSSEKQEQKPETKGDVLDFLNDVRDSGTVVRAFGRSSTRSSIKGRDLFRKPTILHRDPTKNKLMLHKRALERTKKAKQTELDIVMKLLSEPLTAAALREWKEINGSILSKDESNSSSEGEQDEEEDVKPDGQANGEQEDGKHNGQENGEQNLKSQMNCNTPLVGGSSECNKGKQSTVCEQSNNFREQDCSVDSPEISLGEATGKELEISLNTTKSTLETDLDSVDVLRNNNDAESIQYPGDQTDNAVQHTVNDNYECTDNIQGKDLIFVEGHETHL